MAASLLVRVKKAFPFSRLLNDAPAALTRLLNVGEVPELVCDLPPAKQGLSLDGEMVDLNFPGAYIQLYGVERSLVALLTFDSPAPGEPERMLLSCTSWGRSSASDLLTAALAIVAATLSEGSIDDSGWYWVSRDEYPPEELMERLRLSEKRANFNDAIEQVYRKLAIHERYPTAPRRS